MSNVEPVGIIPDITIPGTERLGAILNVLSSPGLWVRAGVATLGTGMVIVGIVIMITGTKGVKQAASLVTNVASKGIIK